MIALLPIYVAAGGLALILGAVALSVKKGGTIHRRSGLLFVYAMLVMAITAAILGNVGGGLMTVYFVVTALTTVRPVSPWKFRVHRRRIPNCSHTRRTPNVPHLDSVLSRS